MSQEVSVLLDELETVLRSSDCWMGMPPSIEALSSPEPFCVDTLTFTEWLQWIYIPRLRAIIEQQAPLPKGAQVHPYAEEALAATRVDGARILDVVARLDSSMNR